MSFFTGLSEIWSVVKGVKEMYIFFKKNSCINMNSMILKRKFVVWLSYY